MANGISYPGVTVVQRAIGGVIYLKFNDPRKFDKKGKPRQVMLSTKVPDRRIADKYAKALSTIITGNLFDNPPLDTPPRVREMLGLKTPEEQTNEKTEPIYDSWRRLTAGLLALKIRASLEDREHHDDFAGKAIGDLSVAADAAREDYQKAMTEMDLLRRALAGSQSEAEKWKIKATAFEAQIVQSGMATVADLGDKTVELAAAEYLKEGTKAGKSKLSSIRTWLKHFVEHFGEDTRIQDLTQQGILDYCKVLLQRKEDEGLSVDYIKGHVKYARYLLDYITGGSFPLKKVKAWQRNNLKDEEKEWYWLEAGEPEQLIGEIREARGDYWADAAAIQHGCGFRPSELPLLMTKNVMVDKGKMMLFIEPIVSGKKLVRRLKTKDSKGKLEVPTFAQEAVRRRMKVKDLLLFPRSPEANWHQPTWKGYSPFEKTHMFWTEQAWCSAYLEALYAGVEKVESIQKEPFDGRTLRRTCGKELLLIGKSIDEVAAVLRDHPEMVRKHYARLLPSDVSTER